MFKIGEFIKCQDGDWKEVRAKIGDKWQLGFSSSTKEGAKKTPSDGLWSLEEIKYRLTLVTESLTGKRGRPRTKAPKVNFLLKYDLDQDPIEEFETMEQVKERIDYLVKNERSLRKESMVVYEVKRKKVVSVETKISIK